MKFGFILLVSALVVVSAQQYFQSRPRGLAWFSPKQHVLNRFQQHYYEPVDAEIPYFRYAKPIKNARPVVIISQGDEELISQELIDSNVGHLTDIIGDNRQIFVDTQSRSKASLLPEKVDPRFFFGTATTIRNPFIKTATFTLFSTVTISSVVSCIVEGDFVDAAAQAKPCRRKRLILESIEKTNEQFAIAPSEPLNYEPTALPFPIDTIREKRQIHQQTPSWNPDSLIVSSKEEDDDSNRSRFFSPNSNNNKEQQRFLFHNSYYVASTTVTSYSFVSTTVTKTVDVAIDVGLNCVPTGYVVCV